MTSIISISAGLILSSSLHKIEYIVLTEQDIADEIRHSLAESYETENEAITAIRLVQSEKFIITDAYTENSSGKEKGTFQNIPFRVEVTANRGFIYEHESAKVEIVSGHEGDTPIFISENMAKEIIGKQLALDPQFPTEDHVIQKIEDIGNHINEFEATAQVVEKSDQERELKPTTFEAKIVPKFGFKLKEGFEGIVTGDVPIGELIPISQIESKVNERINNQKFDTNEQAIDFINSIDDEREFHVKDTILDDETSEDENWKDTFIVNFEMKTGFGLIEEYQSIKVKVEIGTKVYQGDILNEVYGAIGVQHETPEILTNKLFNPEPYEWSSFIIVEVIPNKMGRELVTYRYDIVVEMRKGFEFGEGFDGSMSIEFLISIE